MAHNDEANLAAQSASTITRAAAQGFLTDATVASAGSKEGLKNAIRAVRVHADQENYKIALIRAIDSAAGVTNASVAGLTTVAGLLALIGAPAVSGTAIID